jgi:hypothetical protein
MKLRPEDGGWNNAGIKWNVYSDHGVESRKEGGRFVRQKRRDPRRIFTENKNVHKKNFHSRSAGGLFLSPHKIFWAAGSGEEGKIIISRINLLKRHAPF